MAVKTYVAPRLLVIDGLGYLSTIETMELLSTPGFRRSHKKSVEPMRKGETVSFEEVFGEKA
jgi:putative NADH-flavin reductase